MSIPHSTGSSPPTPSSPYGTVNSLPRRISFASPPNRPSELLIRRRSSSRSQNQPPNPTEWTDAQEERLVYVQTALKKAQRRWSTSQELWIEELDQLLEIKRRHAKTQKATAATRKAAVIWKSKALSKPRLPSILASRKNSGSDGPTISRKGSSSSIPSTPVNGEADENALDSEGEGPLERTNTGSPISNAIRKLSFSVRSTGCSVPNAPMDVSKAVVSGQSPSKMSDGMSGK